MQLAIGNAQTCCRNPYECRVHGSALQHHVNRSEHRLCKLSSGMRSWQAHTSSRARNSLTDPVNLKSWLYICAVWGGLWDLQGKHTLLDVLGLTHVHRGSCSQLPCVYGHKSAPPAQALSQSAVGLLHCQVAMIYHPLAHKRTSC